MHSAEGAWPGEIEPSQVHQHAAGLEMTLLSPLDQECPDSNCWMQACMWRSSGVSLQAWIWQRSMME